MSSNPSLNPPKGLSKRQMNPKEKEIKDANQWSISKVFIDC